jgi:acid stress chaperone HdeB
MHKTLIASAIAVSAFALTEARAQVVVDMTMLTCKQYLEADKGRQDIIAAWMSGYFNAARGNPVFNASQFTSNRNRVSAYCKKHRPETLMSAIQRSAR